MQKVFWDNPYQTHLITHVSSVNGNCILFDETIAFSFFVGQESDSEYDKIIAQNMPIKTGFSDIENQRRYWEIDGFSQVPCGGTHVKSTGEVGAINLKRVNVGRGKERIEIRLINDC
ncbi:MAG TPA: hypothetical protein VLJ15_01615 [Gammaproteobacteria bacterium]|nr:hypothetical protein [Gammaproteobacteria bacterium]